MNNPAFRKYLEDAFGPEGAAKVTAALECPPSVSVRLNPAKWGDECNGVQEIAGERVAGRVPWCDCGYLLESRPLFTLDPAMHSGAYYVQDSSSMFVGFVFGQVLGKMTGKPEEGGEVALLKTTQPRTIRVLDLCAAPGGKTTDIAARLRGMLGDGFLLVSNEVMKNRVGTLADNVALWGDPNVVVTSADPAAFAGLAGFFDVILTDVPCSGEGMFRKDESAAEQWSEETVGLCAARQRRILADVWPALAPGGTLIYSTCTFNRIENDANVGWIASELGAEIQSIDCPFEGPMRTEFGFSLAPGYVPGEGQYCAVMRKTGDGTLYAAVTDAQKERPDTRQQDGRSYGKGKFRKEKLEERKFEEGKFEKGRPDKRDGSAASFKELSEMFSTEVSFWVRNELIIAVPQRVGAELATLEACLKPIAAGVAAGAMKAGSLVPSADLALSAILSPDAFPDAPLDKKAALEFLHRDSIRLEDSPLGYITVSYKGHRLGFVKNIGSRCNNLHPMSRRILMSLI